MFTSDEKRLARAALDDALLAAFFAFFGGVYELFSHEVYSYWMIYAFLFPLTAGLVLILAALKCKLPPGRKFLNAFNSASATLALGSIAAGVVSIYGSTNVLVKVYPIAGALMLLTALFFFVTEEREQKTDIL